MANDLRQEILQYFDGRPLNFYERYGLSFQKAGKDWKALCAFHRETEPSLTVYPDGGWYCFGEKLGGDIFDFYARKHGLDTQSDFPEILSRIADEFGITSTSKSSNRKVPPPWERPIEKEYSYFNESGNLAYKVFRFGDGQKPKFLQGRPGEGGRIVWNFKGVKTVLYRLQTILDADQVIVVEGEKDADNMAKLGLVATTGPMGAKHWKADYSEALRGKHVILCGDNDEAGREHVSLVGEALQDIAASVRVLELPDLPPGGDVTDWIDRFEDSKEAARALTVLIQGAKPFESSPVSDNGLSARIQELNQKHAVIMVGGKCVVINEVTDPVFGRPDITLSRVVDFRNFYANRKIQNPNSGKGQQKEVSVAKVWLEAPDRREYQGIVFDPEEDINGYYNLWRGFSIKPKPGDWSLFKEHIYENIAHGRQRTFEYLLAWMAHTVQCPGGRRPGVSIVLRGKEGSGKGVYATIFGSLLGPHFLHITNQRQITGRFNNHLKAALLVFCDEGIWAGDKAAEGVLKGMITEDLVLIEPKGKDPFAVKNRIRLIVASNNDWVVPAGLEARRFLVLDVADYRRQDFEYFRKLCDQMEGGGREGMLHELLNQDLSGCNLQDVPKTDALFEQKLHSMSSVQKFWFERLLDGTLHPEHGYWKGLVITQVLHKAYVGFAKDHGDRYPVPSDGFIKQLKKIVPRIRQCRVSEGGGRPRGYQFPELEQCREYFEGVVGTTIKWNEEGSE